MFRYYITDTMEGLVVGTNNTQKAQSCAMSEDYFVVDSSTGEWMQANGTRVKIEPMPS